MTKTNKEIQELERILLCQEYYHLAIKEGMEQLEYLHKNKGDNIFDITELKEQSRYNVKIIAEYSRITLCKLKLNQPEFYAKLSTSKLDGNYLK